jgi:hypothetical protein
VDFFFELLTQVVLELVVDGLQELGFRRVASALRSQIGRLVVAVVVGLAAGVAWGFALSGDGRTTYPKLLGVSLLLAATALILAGVTRARSVEVREGRLAVFQPWRWTARRLLAFATLNVSLAVGVAVGFSPA